MNATTTFTLPLHAYSYNIHSSIVCVLPTTRTFFHCMNATTRAFFHYMFTQPQHTFFHYIHTVA